MPSYGAVAGQGLFESVTTAAHRLGYAIEDESGNRYRYVRAGAALVVGDMVQTAPQVTAHQALVPTAIVPLGATLVRLTLGAAAAAENLYAGGWMYVSVAPGLGQRARINGHSAVLSGGVITLRLDTTDAIRVALSTVSRVGLQRQMYDGVIQTPITTLTGAVVGVAVAPIASGEYGWIQDDGVAMVKIAGAVGVGLAVVVPGTAAGAVVVDGAAAATKVVGSMLATGADGLVAPVKLHL